MNDELQRLINMYDRGHLSRRQLVQGLLGVGFATSMVSSRGDARSTSGQRKPLFRAHTITGLAVHAEDKDFCEFRLEHGFLGLYALEAGQHAGYDHFCLGVDDFDAPRALAALKSAVPEAQPSLEFGDQVYLRDPDGARVQLADVKYKR